MSVLLKSVDGNEVELALIRESLPEVQDGTGDASFVTVTYRAATADESWEESAPCLNLFELETLAEWLEAVGSAHADGEPGEIELLSPELKFSIVHEGAHEVTLRVEFNLADRPEVFNVDAPTEEADHVDLKIPRQTVLTAGRALRSALREFDAANIKDDVLGESDSGLLGRPDEGLNIVDRISREPPGAGHGEDNAGRR